MLSLVELLRQFHPPENLNSIEANSTVRQKMRLLSTVLVTALLASVGFSQKVGNWDGEVYGTVLVRVVEEKDGKPICGARVWLLTSKDRHAYQAAERDREGFAKANGPIERFGSRVFTDDTGEAKIWTPFEAGGDMLADGTRTTCRFVRGIVIIEDPQHQRFESELAALLPKDQKPEDSAPVSITIKLKPEANQRPEGTPGKSPSSNPSQVPGAPHP